MPSTMGSCELILLAAGFSRRYGGNKLLSQWQGAPMYFHALGLLEELHRRHPTWRPLVVTQYPEIQGECARRGIRCLINHQAEEGISASIRLGLSQAEGEAAAFFVADQPYLRLESAERLLDGFFRSGKGLGCVSWNGQLGNPCVFSQGYYPALLALTGDRGGKKILRQHLEDVFCCPVASGGELEDIDQKPI